MFSSRLKIYCGPMPSEKADEAIGIISRIGFDMNGSLIPLARAMLIHCNGLPSSEAAIAKRFPEITLIILILYPCGKPRLLTTHPIYDLALTALANDAAELS